jgi:hypothetical protein
MTMTKNFFTTASLAICLLGLTACSSNVKQTLGLERNKPDEFSVVERAPLTLPPEYSLVPPADGSDVLSANVVDTKTLVLGSQSSAPLSASRAETLLLKKAGHSDSTIRQQLNGEDMDAVEETAAQKLGLVESDQKGKALDAVEESS